MNPYPRDIEMCNKMKKVLKLYKDNPRPIHIQLWDWHSKKAHERLVKRGSIHFDGVCWVLTSTGKAELERVV